VYWALEEETDMIKVMVAMAVIAAVGLGFALPTPNAGHESVRVSQVATLSLR
jgi:hypothetical protein